jgi:hypothetical protein
MALHPTAEAYRQARAAGDDTTAASLLMQAHSGTYNAPLIDQFHQVGRMSRAELAAPAPSNGDEPVDRNEVARIKVTTRIFGRR